MIKNHKNAGLENCDTTRSDDVGKIRVMQNAVYGTVIPTKAEKPPRGEDA